MHAPRASVALVRLSFALSLALSFALSACAPSPPPPATTGASSGSESAPPAIERACFSGTADNGVCQIFSAAREPLSLVAAHCRHSGGTWLEACPTEGRIGACAGDGQTSVYYGPGLGSREARRACEAEGHVFTP